MHIRASGSRRPATRPAMRPWCGRCPGTTAACWSGTGWPRCSVPAGPACSFRTRPSVWACKAASPRLAAVLDDELETSRRAQARDRRSPVDHDHGVLDPRAHRWRSRAMIAVSRSSGFCRLSKGSSTMNIEAKLGLLACAGTTAPRRPPVRDRPAFPGRSSRPGPPLPASAPARPNRAVGCWRSAGPGPARG